MGSVWEQRAFYKAIRGVRCNPKNSLELFEKEVRQYDNLEFQLLCTCPRVEDVPGTKVDIDGHVVLVPMTIAFRGFQGSHTHPNDPLCILGTIVRASFSKIELHR